MLFASVSSTPKKISSAAGGHLAEQDAGDGDGESGRDDLPFAFQLVGDARRRAAARMGRRWR